MSCVPLTFIHAGRGGGGRGRRCITEARQFFDESLQIFAGWRVNKIKTPDARISHANSRQAETQLFLSGREATQSELARN